MITGAMPEEKHAERLADAITCSVRRMIESSGSGVIGIPFSGGLDSSLVAAAAIRRGGVGVRLYSVGLEGSADLAAARRVGLELGVRPNEVIVDRRMIEGAIPAVAALLGRRRVGPLLSKEWGMDEDSKMPSPVQLGFGLVLHFACRAAAGDGIEMMMTGQGADELFLGYKRYESMDESEMERNSAADLADVVKRVVPCELRIASGFGVSLRYPFLSDAVVSLAGSIPAGLKIVHSPEPFTNCRKWILRMAALESGLPLWLCDSPKRAAQYGSGIAGELKEMAKKEGLRQNEFLERFL